MYPTDWLAPVASIGPLRVNAPAAASAAAPDGRAKTMPLSKTVGLPKTEAVRVLPILESITANVPVMAARFCAEAFASSATAPGSTVSLNTGALFVLITPRKSEDVGGKPPTVWTMMAMSGVMTVLTERQPEE